MIDVRVARGSGPTGRILTNLLAERGLMRGDARAVVCYGAGTTSGRPTLNGNAGTINKFQQFERMRAAGVRVPNYYTANGLARGSGADVRYPLLARHFNHVGGTDIMAVLEPEEIAWRIAAGAQFFVEYVPSVTEFRVWVYRRKHLGTYQKVMVRPRQYKKIGRNYDNGFAFQLVRSDDVPRDAVDAASAAVEALGLDFGAVDILQGKDGRFYVLEVNTAPGVEGEGRQVIQALADKIARWVELGYPARKGTAEAAAERSRPAPRTLSAYGRAADRIRNRILRRGRRA